MKVKYPRGFKNHFFRVFHWYSTVWGFKFPAGHTVALNAACRGHRERAAGLRRWLIAWAKAAEKEYGRG